MITAEQKADLGRRYLEKINARIKTRNAAQIKFAEKAKGLDDQPDTDIPQYLVKVGDRLARHHRLSGPLTKIERAHFYSAVTHKYIWGVRLTNEQGESVMVVPVGMADLDAQLAAMKDAQRLSHELCQEVQLLHDLTGPARVAEFQAHASRLWAPSGKDVFILDIHLDQLVAGYVDAKRPAVCRVA